ALSAAIASHSRHPYSLALAEMRDPGRKFSFDGVSEHPGLGLEARSGGNTYRLGRPDWAITESQFDALNHEAVVVLSSNGRHLATFGFDAQLRAGAREAISDLADSGFELSILSGD